MITAKKRNSQTDFIYLSIISYTKKMKSFTLIIICLLFIFNLKKKLFASGTSMFDTELLVEIKKHQNMFNC
jgi:hypothetical protein